MPSIEYRFANAADIDQLVELRVLMQLEVNGFSDEHASTEYLESVKNYFIESLKNQKYSSAIAVDGDVIVGTAGLVSMKSHLVFQAELVLLDMLLMYIQEKNTEGMVLEPT